MSFWKGLLAAGRRGPGPLDDFWYQPVGSVTWAGVRMDPDAAMRIATVFACVRVIAEDVAKQPLPAYRRLADGKEPAPEHYLDRLFHSGSPNSEQTDFEFRELMTAWAVLRGRAYAEIRYGRAGVRDMELLPIPPARIREERRRDGTPRWWVCDDDGTERALLREDLFIVTGPMGLSVVEYARQSFGLAMAGESYRAHGYANNMTPTIVLEHPANLSKPAQDRLRQNIAERHQGVANAKRPLILEEGMRANALQMTAEDAQWLEGQKFSAEEIAGRWFRMQLHKVGLLDHATYSNIEHQNIEHATDTILPWNVRWEKAIRQQLLLPEERGRVFCEHNMDGLLRGDIKTRYEAYAIARQWGFMSANDIRRRENMNPIDDGDIYLEPMNMVPAGSDRTALRQNGGGTGGAAVALAEPPTVREAERALRDAGLTRSEARAVLARRGAGLRDASSADGEEHAT